MSEPLPNLANVFQLASSTRQGGYLPLPTSPRKSFYYDAHASCYEQWIRGDFSIVPDHTLPYIWDLIMIVTLGATALVLPFEVSLIREPSPTLSRWNHASDIIFIIDMCIQFNLAFTVNSASSHDMYERVPFKIWQRYMAFPFSDGGTAGWFWPDLLTIIPWDVVAKGRARHLQGIRGLRLVRMLRLVRIVRILTARSAIPFAIVRIVRCASITLLITHCLACLWAHIGLYAPDYGYAHEDTWLSMTYLANMKEIEHFTEWECYRLALYFSTVVLTTVGFGDLVPRNDLEVCIMVVNIFFTGLTWAWVVANVVEIIANVDVFGQKFKQIEDEMNSLMRSRGVDGEITARVRQYLQESYSIHRTRHNHKTIEWLSPGLQGELAIASGVGEVCKCISYFKGCSQPDWLIDMAQHFVPFLFSPGEFIMDRNSVSVIRKGNCQRKLSIIGRDAVIGEDMILTTDILKDTTCPRAMTLCETMSLHRSDLVTVCEKHGELNQTVRRAQVRLAVRRAVTYLARKSWANRQSKVRLSFTSNFANQSGMRGVQSTFTNQSGITLNRSHSNKPIPIKATSAGWAESFKQARHGGGLLDELRAVQKQLASIERRLDGQQSLHQRLDAIEERLDSPRRNPNRGWRCFSSPPTQREEKKARVGKIEI
jgi:hypothetical protein